MTPDTFKLSPEQEKKAVELWQKGMSQTSISLRLGVSRRTIWALCQEAK